MAGIRLRLWRSQVEKCSIDYWYPLLAAKEVAEAQDQDDASTSPDQLCTSADKWTMATAFVPLPESFVEYLGSDGIVLPPVPEGEIMLKGDPRNAQALPEDAYDDFGDVDWDTVGDDEDEDKSSHPPGPGDNASSSSSEASGQSFTVSSFPTLEKQLNVLLEAMGREAFIKLNWTSPQDAGWVCGSLKCCSAGDVYMLLKSSDLVQHDLHHAFDKCVDAEAGDGNTSPHKPVLALRRWSNLEKSMEFRCFVLNGTLVAVAQRHPQTFHDYLAASSDIAKAVRSAAIKLFEQMEIAQKLQMQHFIFDMYVDRSHRGWLVDVGPLAEFVNSEEDTNDTTFNEERSIELAAVPPHELLSWEQLYDLQGNENTPIYLAVESSHQANSYKDALRAHRVPIELVTGDLTQNHVEEARAKFEEAKASNRSG